MTSRTIKLSELQVMQEKHDRAYEVGETYQRCTFCSLPVVEKTANWDYWPGSGIILHTHCVGHWRRHDEAGTWLHLALRDYLQHIEDLHFKDTVVGIYGDTDSYEALRERNRQEHPGDSFFNRPTHHRDSGGDYQELMVMFDFNVGIPS